MVLQFGLMTMDNYPADLAPKFDEGGGVSTPFDDWWARVRHRFPNVPEEVAREWLHRHWRYSPYAWLRSAAYKFSLVDWDASKLQDIRSGWCNFEAGNAKCMEHGKYLTGLDYWPSRYMCENATFPTPIVVVDNRDGHLKRDYPDEQQAARMPDSYLLVEGHRRFNLGLYLASVGELNPSVQVWLMTALLPP